MSPHAAAAPDRVDAAAHALGRLVMTQRAGDERYFAQQLPRYRRTLRRLQHLRPTPCRVLDIGSHYLHQAVLLSELGHEVWGIDVPLFAQAPFVQARASTFGVRNESVEALADGTFLPGREGGFDLIVFTEILEHITFNPVRFWERVHALLAPGGIVYVSTPNALRPVAWLRQAGRLLAFRGIGLGIDDVLGSVTYGHHWKEYSAWELRRYFALLSPDFGSRSTGTRPIWTAPPAGAAALRRCSPPCPAGAPTSRRWFAARGPRASWPARRNCRCRRPPPNARRW